MVLERIRKQFWNWQAKRSKKGFQSYCWVWAFCLSLINYHPLTAFSRVFSTMQRTTKTINQPFMHPPQGVTWEGKTHHWEREDKHDVFCVAELWSASSLEPRTHFLQSVYFPYIKSLFKKVLQIYYSVIWSYHENWVNLCKFYFL